MPSIDEQLLKLPRLRDPFPMKLPDGTIDWRFYLPIPDFWPTPEGWKYIPGSNTGRKDNDWMAWARQHQTALLLAGGAVLLFALLGRRR
jgi:hypothetical protein